LSKEQVERTPDRRLSAYFRPEIADSLPAQTLLLDKAGRDTEDLWD
jgi:hypothetical protein